MKSAIEIEREILHSLGKNYGKKCMAEVLYMWNMFTRENEDLLPVPLPLCEYERQLSLMAEVLGHKEMSYYFHYDEGDYPY